MLAPSLALLGSAMEAPTKRKVWLSSLFLWVALAVVLQAQTCERGDTYLLGLELEVDGQDLIQGFNANKRTGYAVTPTRATATLKVDTRMEDSTATYQWFVSGTSIEAGEVGLGGGSVVLNVPSGESALYIGVRAAEGNIGGYWVDVDRTDACASLPDGTPCTDAYGGQDLCLAGVCPSNAVTKDFSMGCIDNLFAGWLPSTWTLTVDPITPVVAGEPFDVAISGEVSVEASLDAVAAYASLVYPRTFTFGTVPIAPRSGATGLATADVSAENGSHVCTFTGTPCDPANDTGGIFSENTDCGPTFNDWCLPFETTTVIDDTGNACTTCAAADEFISVSSGAGSKQMLCEAQLQLGQPNDICTDTLPVPLVPITATYVAEPGATEVLFGFEESDPDPAMNPSPVFNDGVGVDVVQMAQYIGVTGLGLLTIAGSCSMGVVTFDRSPSSLPLAPLPDSALISIPVEQP